MLGALFAALPLGLGTSAASSNPAAAAPAGSGIGSDEGLPVSDIGESVARKELTEADAAARMDVLNADRASRAAAREAALQPQWVSPVAGRLTSCFCMRWGVMHWGIDLAAPMLTPEYAVGDGVVLKAGAASGFGNAIYIQHPNGDVTLYGHMEVVEVAAGDIVTAGQEIAKLGQRGFSTGPHLHLEVHVGGIEGPKIDPIPWLAARGVYY